MAWRTTSFFALDTIWWLLDWAQERWSNCGKELGMKLNINERELWRLVWLIDDILQDFWRISVEEKTIWLFVKESSLFWRNSHFNQRQWQSSESQINRQIEQEINHKQIDICVKILRPETNLKVLCKFKAFQQRKPHISGKLVFLRILFSQQNTNTNTNNFSAEPVEVLEVGKFSN